VDRPVAIRPAATQAATSPYAGGARLPGQVVGVNTAVSSEGQNIGFALPINVMKDALANFNATGQFNRPYLGVRYQMIPKQTAILNDIPEGAYLQEVVEGSPAQKASLRVWVVQGASSSFWLSKPPLPPGETLGR
jgi:S1-C subfamily serine protease